MKVTQLCRTLQPHGLYGILQARVLKWVAFPFSRESSQPRNQTRVSCITGRFFTNWALREAYFPLKGTRIPWTNGRKCLGLTRNNYGSESKWSIKNNWLLVTRTQEPTWRGFHWPKKKERETNLPTKRITAKYWTFKCVKIHTFIIIKNKKNLPPGKKQKTLIGDLWKMLQL